MPLFVRTPHNDVVIKAHGTYRRYLNVLDRKQTAVQRALRRGGLSEYEPAVQATLLALVEGAPASHVFYDVGAHIGLYSALINAVYRRSHIKVVAFEAAAETAAICRLLVAKNRLDFEVVELAVSSTAGTKKFFISPKAETSNSLNPKFRTGAQFVEVQATTIDQFVALGGPAPTVMKLDVETHEPDVIKGAAATIERCRPWIVCEFLDKANRRKVQNAVETLKGLNYSFYRLSDPLWHPHSVDEVVNDLDTKDRDWLLAPSPVWDGLKTRIRSWSNAIAECTPVTNLVVNSGEAAPPEVSASW
ncbi:FkbM family methyltransferase [Hansschlegelia plantiphila]|uniref:FkbM family methyltransferase n=1 Tax=Hansschlegelia plantiphila TaxID=374655 RepID=UPI0022F27EDA|nr:FkbM family methyltransferase [Hansschlegelia plantiphila]